METLFYPLKLIVDWLVFVLFNLHRDTRLAEVIHFFIYDTVKILILLAAIIYLVSVIRSFLPPDKIKKILSQKFPIIGNVLAALFGIVTPFCTCSAIPLFLGFLEAGVPVGVTFSFLIASPMINEVALVLLLGMFGWKIALLYILSGLVIAVTAGLILGRIGAERWITLLELEKNDTAADKITWRMRLDYAKRYTKNIFKKVWPYVLVGIALGALIHGYVPIDFFARYAGNDKWYAVPFAVLLGIPLYSNAAGIVPLVSVLTEKGVAMGTTLAFMMAVTGLSFPEFMILKKVMNIKLIFIFASIVGIGILFTGYIFNLVLK